MPRFGQDVSTSGQPWDIFAPLNRRTWVKTSDTKCDSCEHMQWNDGGQDLGGKFMKTQICFNPRFALAPFFTRTRERFTQPVDFYYIYKLKQFC